ncbi:MAG: HAMP domain-containing histidine kinase [Gammaproteobacteria bacterium]|nr:HAMP domain-containing histidine kinase [Gammaproteobacteria bacterium]
MPRTLYAKLALVMLALVTVLGISYGTFTLYTSKLFMQELNQRFNRDLARQLLVDKGVKEGELIDETMVASIFKRYMHINPAIEIYLLDADGKILAFEAPKMKIKRDHVDLAPLKRMLSGDMSYPIVGDDPRHEDRQKVFSVAAFPWEGEARQYLYVVLAGEDYATAQELLRDSYFLQLSMLAVGGTMLFGILTALFIFNLLTRRLTRLSSVMAQFRKSDFRKEFPYADGHAVINGDELDQLGATYDEMSQRIIEQMESLEQKDSLRRNLIANVSHDLRTPLAALRGYLETLQLKTGTLPVEQRREYLGIAYKHSERLSQLVSDLFELSKLDAHETLPTMELLAIGELVHDVSIKFQLQADEQGKTLRCDPVEELPFVSADIGMLERVLENLISNAIHHTPAGGQITLTMQTGVQGVEVTISNTGEGITEENIPYVFDRFYQSPENRGGSGSGLGLAIVKRILELHGSKITVSSQRGLTTFRFTLPFHIIKTT